MSFRVVAVALPLVLIETQRSHFGARLALCHGTPHSNQTVILTTAMAWASARLAPNVMAWLLLWKTIDHTGRATQIWVHHNRASPFACDFYRGRGYRREFRNEGHFYSFSSQKKSRFASDFLRRGNRASWGLKKNRAIFWGAVKFAAAAAENRAISVHSDPNCHWRSIMLLGSWAFWASSTFSYSQRTESGIFSGQNQALSGIFRGMILHDLSWFHMILHDLFGAQEPRNVSTDGKKLEEGKRPPPSHFQPY